MSGDDLNLRELAARLAERAEDVCKFYLPGGQFIGTEYRAANVKGGAGSKKNKRGERKNKPGSLAVELRGERRGQWADFTDDDHYKGDLLHLIAFNQDCGLGEAAKEARRFLGLSQPEPGRNTVRRPRYGAPKGEPPAPTQDEAAETDPDLERRIAYARKIWAQAQAIQGTLGERYFRARGISIELPPTLRFAPSLRHRSGEYWPAVVGAVQSPLRRITGVWRIFVAEGEDGRVGKAPVTPNKMGLGETRHGAVRLGPGAEHIAVAEGIETALSVMQALEDVPVWAGLSAGGIARLVLPVQCRRVSIYADNDPLQQAPNGKWVRPGPDAADKLRKEALRVGVASEVHLPPAEGQDWNDVLTSGDEG